MKDYIPGSEEFLLRYYDLLKTELPSCLPLPPGLQPYNLYEMLSLLMKPVVPLHPATPPAQSAVVVPALDPDPHLCE
jgi:hypothetical protein